MTASQKPASSGGTYFLLVSLPAPISVSVGSLGEISFDRGRYAYVGSAFGPGGLAARLRRYAAGPRRNHWHIDHLLDQAQVLGALVSTDAARLECRWASWCQQQTFKCVDGFGASDCRCRSHLFFLDCNHETEQMIGAAGCELQAEYLGLEDLIGGP